MTGDAGLRADRKPSFSSVGHVPSPALLPACFRAVVEGCAFRLLESQVRQWRAESVGPTSAISTAVPWARAPSPVRSHLAESSVQPRDRALGGAEIGHSSADQKTIRLSSKGRFSLVAGKFQAVAEGG